MRAFGRCIFFIGLGWFVLSWFVMAVLIAIESITGETPTLPRAGTIEWAGGLVYFGMYIGSWAVMIIGEIVTLVAFAEKDSPP